MKFAVVLLGLMALANMAMAQTTTDLVRDAAHPESVLTVGLGYGQQRYSPLTQINKENVKNLVPLWNLSLDSNRGAEAQPLVRDGVIYMTTFDATVAVDALTGRQLWKTKINYKQEDFRYACCGIVNRGMAMFDGKLFRGTIDAYVVALDAKTGKEVWRSKAAEIKDGYSMTGSPLIADGVLITGVSGADMGIRGFLDGWDPETGKHLWRRYTIPAPGEKGSDTWPGDTWKRGGASTWLVGSYDPQLDLVYWGTGNAGPWNPRYRKGDNLYTSSVLAIRPKTGEIVWHYQFSPNDGFDYDGVNELVNADLMVNGQKRRVLMQANRNGYFYILDRTNGQLIAANAFVKVTWAEGIDLKTGRPILSAANKKMRETGEGFDLWPSAMGGKNMPGMAYDPKTGLVYANTQNIGWHYQPVKPVYRSGTLYLGTEFNGWLWPGKEPHGYLQAIDPLTGKSRWKMPWKVPSYSAVIATASNLLFTGSMDGEFMAIDAESGKKLWSFQTGSGIVGQPITWEKDGKQYVTVPSGIGGGYALFAGDEGLKNVPAGDSLWTFALPD